MPRKLHLTAGALRVHDGRLRRAAARRSLEKVEALLQRKVLEDPFEKPQLRSTWHDRTAAKHHRRDAAPAARKAEATTRYYGVRRTSVPQRQLAKRPAINGITGRKPAVHAQGRRLDNGHRPTGFGKRASMAVGRWSATDIPGQSPSKVNIPSFVRPKDVSMPTCAQKSLQVQNSRHRRALLDATAHVRSPADLDRGRSRNLQAPSHRPAARRENLQSRSNSKSSLIVESVLGKLGG